MELEIWKSCLDRPTWSCIFSAESASNRCDLAPSSLLRACISSRSRSVKGAAAAADVGGVGVLCLILMRNSLPSSLSAALPTPSV